MARSVPREVVHSRNRSVVGLLSCAACAVALALLLLPFSPGIETDRGVAHAQSRREPKRQPPEARTVQSVGSYEQRLLQATQEAMEADDHEAALESLRKLEAHDKRNDYETAVMQQLFGHVYSQLGDYDRALGAFEAAITTGALPAQALVNLRYNLGQLYLAVERYDDAIRTLESWLESVENPSSRGYVLLAHAFVSKGDYARALAPIRTAVERSSEPDENWLRLLLTVLIELEQLEEAAKVLEALVAHFSSKIYWTQLSAIYASLDRDLASLNAMEMAYRLGYLTRGEELVRMAELYLYNGVPYQAGVVLEKGIAAERIEKNERNWQLLADSWISAREYDRALLPLQQAALISKQGDLALRLGHVYLQTDDWQNAAAALRSALEKGGLDKPSSAQLLLGISLFNLGESEGAEKAFANAARDEATRESAREWLAHLRARSSR